MTVFHFWNVITAKVADFPMSDTTVVSETLRLHDKDTGSADVQIANLTERIKQLSSHLEAHTKDHSTRRGLLRLVSQRRKLLDYLKANESDRYQRALKELGLRR